MLSSDLRCRTGAVIPNPSSWINRTVVRFDPPVGEALYLADRTGCVYPLDVDGCECPRGVHLTTFQENDGDRGDRVHDDIF